MCNVTLSYLIYQFHFFLDGPCEVGTTTGTAFDRYDLPSVSTGTGEDLVVRILTGPLTDESVLEAGKFKPWAQATVYVTGDERNVDINKIRLLWLGYCDF